MRTKSSWYKSLSLLLSLALILSGGCSLHQHNASDTSVASATLSLDLDAYYAFPIKDLYAKAKAGDKIAQRALGWRFSNGAGVKRNNTKARYWWQKAAEQGDAVSQLNLGGMYYYGNGVSKDYKKAFKWYKKSAENGDRDAQYSLGYLYTAGKNAPQDNESF